MESIQNAILRGQLIDWLLLSLFVFLFFIHLVYMLRFHLRVASYKNLPAADPEPLSLLLTFRNEEFKLNENLSEVLDSSSGNFEVVAVDNCSQDQSLSVLTALKHEYPHLRVSSLKQHVLFSDKMAQNIGLKAAQYEWVNVIPPSVKLPGDQWIEEVSSRLNSGSQTVVHYSNVIPGNRFFNLLYRAEFFFQQLKSFGFILNGLPFVFSQDNVSFKKQQYFNEGGYRGIISEPFAKLELVINAFIRKAPVSLVVSAETAIGRNEDVSWKEYLELLKKEEKVRNFLPAGTRAVLMFIEWAYLLFAPVAALILVRMPALWPIVCVLSIGLIAGNLLIIKRVLVRLKEYKLFLPSFLIALMLPFIKMVFHIGFFRYGLKKEWKIGN